MDSVEARLKKLEKRTKGLYGLVITALAIGFSTGYATSTSFDTLRVKELIIEDSKGNKRISFNTNDSDEALQRFYDKAGIERIRHGVLEDGTSRHRMFNEKGDVSMSSSVYRTDTEYQTVGFSIYKEGRLVSNLGYSTSEQSLHESQFQLFNPETGSTALNILSNNNMNIMRLYDKNTLEDGGAYPAWVAYSDDASNTTSIHKNGFARWKSQYFNEGKQTRSGLLHEGKYINASYAYDESEETAFILADKEGNIRSKSTYVNGISGHFLYDGNGSVRTQVTADDEESYMGVYSAKETPRAMMMASNHWGSIGVGDGNKSGLSPRILIYSSNEDESGIMHFDKQGENTVALGIDDEGDVKNYTQSTTTQDFESVANWVGTAITIGGAILRK